MSMSSPSHSIGVSSPVASPSSSSPSGHKAPSSSSSSISSSSTQTNGAGEKLSMTQSTKSTMKKTSDDYKPSFHYDSQVLEALIHYLETKNQTGLALIARQKGIPPFLRFQVWPTLLKYHPFVRAPFITPNRNKPKSTKKNSQDDSSGNEESLKSPKSGGSSLNNSDNDDMDDYLKLKIMKDLARYSHKYYHYRPSNNAAVPQNQYTITTASPTTNGSTTAATSTSPSETSSPKLVLKSEFADDPPPITSNAPNFEEIELQIFTILQNSIHKFISKWGKIISYDSSLTWMALNLAEWFPPIANTSWVLIGRDAKTGSGGQHVHSHVSEDNDHHGNSRRGKNVMDLLDDYSNYINNVPDLQQRMQELVAQGSLLTFYEVYERLSLVLLHLPETRHDSSNNNLGEFKVPKKVNKTSLPVTGGTIEERVLFFVYCLRNLLPELSQFFQEEQILKKFGPGEDEWLLWWLKYTTTKCWSKYDRGRIWDLMFGWRAKNPKKSNSYYLEKLAGPSLDFIDKLGPDVFWVPRTDANAGVDDETDTLKEKDQQQFTPVSSGENGLGLSCKDEEIVPYSHIDPHIEVVFISIAMLKAVENTLVELDQHEIRQYLSRLPSKSYAVKSRRNKMTNDVNNGDAVKSGSIISNDSPEVHRVDYIDNIINEAGEMWRKWLYLENIDDL